ncbi:HET-domain-containing protein [Eremomyces bilateralis CBS 781.70]|uniref:HET-domain-containing protein n=1 Tax=Eremomyces bilateralis CBS 781.70 TaxID=1392243 RepID=A0A6G1GH83_9PEZI|nr:HET-domain-containing protein [Eremomyces bilateralis CBS 781.70]KAF1817413.1 HET-domain-containing protein [Eremomyces bilateralis CBS 781.70]
MRLLNTETRELKGFVSGIPRYAILSHTWGEEEVTLQRLNSATYADWSRPQFSKIAMSCDLARGDGHQWIWIDTCRIDKTSSAELSEAINSMFLRYHGSRICYVYLVDVPDGDDPHQESSAFSRSRWFTRGWTLQELIAPESVEFYTIDWQYVGSREDLSDVISQVTGIFEDFLQLHLKLGTLPASRKMSWAARRKIALVEDVTYCLLGLFGIHIPLLYGEGTNAFRRL